MPSQSAPGFESSEPVKARAKPRRDLTPEQHARIRRHLVLIPLYIWLVFGWASFVTHLPPGYFGVKPEDTNKDFVHFYVQAAVAARHDAAALYDMEAQAKMVPALIPGSPEMRYPPVYGPQVSVFFSPLAHLPFLPAFYVWLVTSAIVYAICSYAMWRICPRLNDRRGMVVVLLVGAPAFHFMLGFGQVSAIGLACVTIAYLALDRGRPFLAGLAIGMLAYKPPLALAIACVFVLSLEWRIVIGAAVGVAAQMAVGVAYWGAAILPAYVAALTRVPDVANAMEPHKFHMHSWRAFFELLGLSSRAALVPYAVASIATIAIALKCWRSRRSLALRFSALLIATLLVDPHMYVYDFVLLTPAFLLLWDWTLARQPQTIGDVGRWAFGGSTFDGSTFDRSTLDRFRRASFPFAFEWLLYVCYLSPLFGIFVEAIRVQSSVLLLLLLMAVLTFGEFGEATKDGEGYLSSVRAPAPSNGDYVSNGIPPVSPTFKSV